MGTWELLVRHTGPDELTDLPPKSVVATYSLGQVAELKRRRV